jgi:hypothetical protein
MESREQATLILRMEPEVQSFLSLNGFHPWHYSVHRGGRLEVKVPSFGECRKDLVHAVLGWFNCEAELDRMITLQEEQEDTIWRLEREVRKLKRRNKVRTAGTQHTTLKDCHSPWGQTGSPVSS